MAEYEAEVRQRGKGDNELREDKSVERGKENVETKKIDYNALDYEQENQSDEDVPKKQVPSLVQYPLPGAIALKGTSLKKRRSSTSETDTTEDKKDALVQNARSDVLAMALGVQIKTGEDSIGDSNISG